MTDIGALRASNGAGITHRATWLVVAVFFVVAAGLNGRALHEKASKRAYGPARDVWMMATAPLRQFSEFTRLDQFRVIFEKVLDHSS